MLYNYSRVLYKVVEWGENMTSKIVKITLILTIIISIFWNYNVQAITDPLTNPDAYKPSGALESTLLGKGGRILGAISTIGTVLSVVVLMIIGIKYMTGSVEEKAEYKKTMTSYMLGAFLLFAATTLPNLLYNITQALF